MKTILLASAAAVVMVGAASAADLPPAPAAPVLPPTFSWTGCYLGGFLGGAWTEGVTISNGYAQLPGFPNTAWGYSLSNSLIGGGTLGCNWQPAGTPWVVGIEGAARST